MKAKNTKMYSAVQIAELKRLAATAEPVARIARKLSKEWNRAEGGLYVKIANIRKSGGTVVKRENRLELPQGFKFDFKPTKAEVYQDHVRLYF
jgi:hypothetical protein